jgi:hypothetical protein
MAMMVAIQVWDDPPDMVVVKEVDVVCSVMTDPTVVVTPLVRRVPIRARVVVGLGNQIPRRRRRRRTAEVVAVTRNDQQRVHARPVPDANHPTKRLFHCPFWTMPCRHRPMKLATCHKVPVALGLVLKVAVVAVRHCPHPRTILDHERPVRIPHGKVEILLFDAVAMKQRIPRRPLPVVCRVLVLLLLKVENNVP